MIVEDNHSSVRFSKCIQSFCSEIFEKTPLNFFIYGRFYNDGRVINLTTHPKWHQYYRKQNYHLDVKKRLVKGIHAWRDSDHLSKYAREAREMYGIYNKIEMIEEYDGYIDSFGYGGGNKIGALDDFYLNNIDLLKEHNKCFLSKAVDIINLIDEKGQYLEVDLSNMENISNEKVYLSMPDQKTKIKFFDTTNGEKNVISFTPKQFNILSLKLRGYSDEFIAKCLKCSIHNIKYHYKKIIKNIPLNYDETIHTKCHEIGVFDVSRSYKSLLG